jgi:lipid-binding SYLF domain-containing protein
MRREIEMKRMMLLATLMSLTTFSWADTDATIDRLQNAGNVLHEIMAAPDKGIPQEVFEHAKCIAVVPHMVKGAFIFGAEGGRGVATCRTAEGWSAPAFFAITGGSWGLQIGVEGVDLVMVVQNEKGMQQLLSSKFQVGADASAAAGPVGRHASADTDWKLNAEILTYSRAKGVFAGLNLSGSAVRRDDDSMKAIYGPDVSTGAVLRGQVPPTPPAWPFLDAVKNAKADSERAAAESK